MTLVLETGTGVRNANSYITPSFVTNYLTDLNRNTENSWDSRGTLEQDAACIAGSQYIDVTNSQRFKGSKAVYFNGEFAKSLLSFNAQPQDEETVTIGSRTFTYRATEQTIPQVGDIVIGADLATTIDSTISTINNDEEVLASLFDGQADSILLTAPFEGSPFNDTPVSNSGTNIDTNNFQGGEDPGSQPMQFPRASLFDRSGRRVVGIPLNLKQAAAEYAVRAVASTLLSDPTTNASGRIVQEEFVKAGPVEQRTVYAEGASLEQLIKPYPLADMLLKDYLKNPGVFR